MKTSLRYYFLVLFLIPAFTSVKANNISTRATGSDATLKSIVLSTATTLIFTTGPSDFNYTTSVSPGTATLTVEPTTNDPGATVTVNGATVANGAQSAPVTLNGIVTTTINMLVTASDGVTKLSYSIVVYETGSNNAFLSALTVSTGNTLVASTGSSNYNYTTTVAPTVSSLTVTPTTADVNGSVTVNGVAVTSGSASGVITLNTGTPTVVNLVVTAQDNVTTQTYSITISRTGSNIATLSNLSLSTNTNLIPTSGSGNFSSTNFSYTATVNASVSSLTVTPTATDPNISSIKVGPSTVANGSASPAITLNAAGLVTNITVVVTAQDGSTTQTYTIAVSRTGSSIASLSSIVLNSSSLLVSGTNGPGNQLNYTTSVDPALNSIIVTPTAANANATITVNGVAVTTGTPSGSIALNAYPATTVITLISKSQDGSNTIPYVITVSKNGSNNANFFRLLASTNTSFTFSTSTTPATYTTSVPIATTALTLTPTAQDSTRATIKVNGVVVPSSTASASITLNAVGTPTSIPLVITAQDGVTMNTYNVIINRTGSNNANISTLVLSNNALLVATTSSPGVQNYTTSVSPTATSMTFTPTTSDPSASIKVNGSTATSGQPFTVALPTATTTVTIVVTAPDGVTTKSYVTTVSKNGSNNANLVPPYISLSTGTTLTGTTGPYSANFTTIVTPRTTSLTATPITADPNATITVNGLAVVNGSASSSIPLNTTGTTLIIVVVTAEDKVTTKSYGVTISKTGNYIYWTGKGTSWSSAASWSPAKIPGAGDVASFGEVIYTGTGQPSLSQPVTVGEIVFGQFNTPKLVIPSGYKLTITTALTVKDSSAATIYTTNALSSVDIAAGATLNILNSSSTPGTLTLNTPATSGTPIIFTLKSNASGSASVGQITSSSIIYNGSTINVERYITGGSPIYRGYRLLSSPVHAIVAANGNNVYSLDYVQGTSLVTGSNVPTPGGFDKDGNPSLYLFREDVAANNGSFTGGNYWGVSNLLNGLNNVSTTTAPSYLFNGLASPSYNIPVGNGFMFFFRGDRTTNFANKYSSGTSAESVTMVQTGILNAGSITVHDWYAAGLSTISYTTSVTNGGSIGLHLVGNPYASTIDWDTYNNTTPGSGIYAPGIGGNTSLPSISKSIYMLDPVSKNYGVYMANSGGGGTNNATHLIASGQGFFITAFSPAASLTFNEDAKSTAQLTGPNLLLGTPKQDVVSQYMRVKLLQNAFQADEILISFDNTAKSKFVPAEDAVQKPGYGIASLASMSSDGLPLSINTLNLPQQAETIRLNVNANTDGNYQLTVPEIKSIPALFDVWLMDTYKKDSVDLRKNPDYGFNIVKGDTSSFGANRFSLVIRQNPALGLHLVNFNATKATVGANVVWTTQNEENYTNFTIERSTDGGIKFDVLGGFISSDLGKYNFTDKNPLMTANRYRLKLEDYNGNITYSDVVTLMYGNSPTNIAGNINVYPNPASSTLNLSVTPFSDGAQALKSGLLQNTSSLKNPNSVSYGIKIISITGAVIRSVTSSSTDWHDNVSNLVPGTYIIQVVNNNDNSVVGKSTFVKL